MKKALITAAAVLVLSMSAHAQWKTDYGVGNAAAEDATNSFSVGSGQTLVKAISAKADHAGAVLKLYDRQAQDGAAMATNAASAGNKLLSVSNTAARFAVGDIVVYQHGNGQHLVTTVAATNTALTTVTLTDGILVAGTSKDRLYEMTQNGQVAIGATAYTPAGDVIYATPAKSPLLIVLDAGVGTNSTLTTTVSR